MQIKIDKTLLQIGIIEVSGLARNKYKIKILYLDKIRQSIVSEVKKEREKLFLPCGAGEYLIEIYLHIEGDTYSKVKVEKIFFNPVEKYEEDLFKSLNSKVGSIYMNQVINIAKELCLSCKSDLEKINKVYEYCSQKILYDFVKALLIKSPYVPDLETVIKNKAGICYDKALLMTIMLRGQNVPIKMIFGRVRGYSSRHAWCEVFIDGQWKIKDPTFLTQYSKDHYMQEEIY